MIRMILATVAMVAATPALAQDGGAAEHAFIGPSAGVETGYLEHHFVLAFEEYDASGAIVSGYDRYYRSHGVGGGAFAGYDIAISGRGRLGVELSGSAGGRDNAARLPEGDVVLSPRFGAKVAVRAGYVLTPRLMGYVLTGYGGNAYRVRDTIGIEGIDDLRWGSSFIVGAGAEYRLGRSAGIRIDGKHVDNQTWQLFVGVPIRF